VSVAAPGARVLSTYPVRQGSYATLSGTSMAAPHVTAQAALLYQVPGATKAKVMQWIKTTCDPLPHISVQCGGRINVYRSVHLAVNGTDPGTAPSPAPTPPETTTPAVPAGRFTPPALPQGFAASAGTRSAQVTATSTGNAANVAWNGAFWLSAPNVPVGLCNVEDAATIAAATSALNRLAAATARGLGWQIARDDAACDSGFSQPRLLITRDTVPDDTSAARTGVKDITGASCDVAAGAVGCWVNSGTITLNAAAFDMLTEEQQALTVLREIARALGLSHSTACTDSLLISADRCPDATPADLGADDIASLNELLAAALKALNG
jgi:hypothetical protein